MMMIVMLLLSQSPDGTVHTVLSQCDERAWSKPQTGLAAYKRHGAEAPDRACPPCSLAASSQAMAGAGCIISPAPLHVFACAWLSVSASQPCPIPVSSIFRISTSSLPYPISRVSSTLSISVSPQTLIFLASIASILQLQPHLHHAPRPSPRPDAPHFGGHLFGLSYWRPSCRTSPTLARPPASSSRHPDRRRHRYEPQ